MKYDFYYFDKMYSIEECEYISKMLKLCADPRFIERPAEDVKKTSIVYMSLWKRCKDFLGEFEDLVHHVNNENFGFDLHRFTGHEAIHHNVYKEEVSGQYDWHSDGSVGEMYDFKLTAIINLSTEQYEGGNLELFLKRPMHIKGLDNPGSILIFPSYMQHRVTSVTKGERSTVTMWIRGPLFR